MMAFTSIGSTFAEASTTPLNMVFAKNLNTLKSVFGELDSGYFLQHVKRVFHESDM